MRYLFTLIRLFLQLSWFSFYATARLFLFMSLSGFSYLCHFPTLFSFSHCPHPLTSLPDFFFIYVIARLDRAIQQFIFWHLRLFFLSSAASLPVICGFSLCHYPA
jgi:hypothetical protein